MPSQLNVTSAADASGNLEFKSRVSGDALIKLDGTNDAVTIGSGAVFVNGNGSVPVFTTGTPVDIDATNGTLLIASMLAGIIVHTSVTGAGTLTFDTAANIVAAAPWLNTVGRTIQFLIVNDGDQTVTLAVATGVTIADTGATIATNEAALVWLRCASTDNFVAYIAST